jgi:hypothetical protein
LNLRNAPATAARQRSLALILVAIGLVVMACPALFARTIRFESEAPGVFSLVAPNGRLTNDHEVGGPALAVDTLSAKGEWNHCFKTAAGLFLPGKEYLITFDLKVNQLGSNALVIILMRPLGAEGPKFDVLNFIPRNVGEVRRVRLRCRIQPDQTNQAFQVHTRFQAQAHLGNLVIQEGPAPKLWGPLTFGGSNIPLYETPVAHIAHLLGDEGSEVSVELLSPAQKAVVRPLRYGISPTLRGKRLSFKLPKGPSTLSVEIDGNLEQPLFVFSKPAALYRPAPGTQNMITFAAGKVHRPGNIILTSGQTLYIEDGAVVMGSVSAKNATNIRITGGGILDGSEYARHKANMVRVDGCQGVLIQGITVLNSPWWTMPLLKSRDILVDGIKVVSGRENDDGCDICGSSNVTIRNSFYRTKDDCIALKSVGPWINGIGNVEDVTVEDCVLWNSVWGNGVEIGYELTAEVVRNVSFRNLDFIHVEGNAVRDAVMSIHLGDRAMVSNILYENIRVEDVEEQLIYLTIAKMDYSKDAERGRIQDVVFRNLSILGPRMPPIKMFGFDETHLIKNVLLEGLTLNGKPIKTEAEARLTKKFAEGVLIR